MVLQVEKNWSYDKGKIRRRWNELSTVFYVICQERSNGRLILISSWCESCRIWHISCFISGFYDFRALMSLFLRWPVQGCLRGWKRHLWGHRSQVPVLPKIPLWNLEVNSGHQGQRSGGWLSQGDYPAHSLSHWAYRQDNKLCIVI